MNKTFVLVLGILSSAVLAEDKVLQPLPEKVIEPKLHLAIFDTSNKVARQIEGLQYSLSNHKNLSLCWTAFDLAIKHKNQVKEIFSSPKKATFTDSSGINNRSKEGTKHQIETNLAGTNNEFIQKCWAFDKSDPLGKYSIEVQINNIKYPALSFEIIK